MEDGACQGPGASHPGRGGEASGRRAALGCRWRRPRSAGSQRAAHRRCACAGSEAPASRGRLPQPARPQLQALRKYAKVYEIPHTATTGKEEMASLISKHWDKMVGAGAGRRAACCGCRGGGAGRWAVRPRCRQPAPTPALPARPDVQVVSEEQVLQNLLRVRGRH